VLPAERIRAVETGGCPHTAIRDDISANLEAIDELERSLPPLDLILVESGGDNLTAAPGNLKLGPSWATDHGSVASGVPGRAWAWRSAGQMASASSLNAVARRSGGGASVASS
jgi:hypothetical protein